MKTKKKRKFRGSHPDESYQKSTPQNLHLDKPTMHGGWPEGEYDPPVKDRLLKWYKDMGMMETFVKEVLQSFHD